ncbi:MAG: hypothetical protein HY935_07215 [Nitrosomonadales bacterium]|nr:hypothetical protein [Nitrosomonadales bacterium]
MTTKKNLAATANTSAKKSPVKKAQAPEKSAAKPAGKAAVKTQAGAASKQATKKMKKDHKEKVVRDSFTMPQSEYRKIAEIKETCLKAGLHVKKSEVLRAGLKALCEKSDAQLKLSLKSLEKIRTGRPKKH